MSAPGGAPAAEGPAATERPQPGRPDRNFDPQDFPPPLGHEVRALVAEHGLEGGAIFPVLGAILRARGTISDPAFRIAARLLGVRPGDLRALAIRSGLFAPERPPAHAIAVCVNKHCRRRGSLQLLETIRRETGLLPGQTSREGDLSVETVRCFDACDFGPNVLVDGSCYHAVDPAGMRRILEALRTAPAGR